jgi:hypothetical protein
VVVVPIPESLVKELHIDEECTWFQEIRTKEGIFLKIVSKRIGSSLDVPEVRGGAVTE